MRHSRRSVRTEQFKMYVRRNVINGRYFVRNMQILFGILMVIALVAATVFLAYKKNQLPMQAKVVECLIVETANLEKIQELTVQETKAQSVAQKKEAGVEKETEKKSKKKEIKFEDQFIANVEESLNIRKEPNAEAEFVGGMNAGAVGEVLGTQGEWTKIKSGKVEGYVKTEYILTGKQAEEKAKEYVIIVGTVLEDGVNVRSEQSTEAVILDVLNKEETLKVVIKSASQENIYEQESGEIEQENKEESKEEYEWIEVQLPSGDVGYVASDFIEVEEKYEKAISAKRLEEIAAEEEAIAEAEAKAAAEAIANASSNNTSSSNTSNSQSNDTSYKGETTKPQQAESGDYLGTFTITGYCGCKKCTGKYANGKTASGTTPTENRTIAADTSIFPYGTQLVINGVVYTVEDTGSAIRGNKIDIFFATHKAASNFGTQRIKVYKY